YGGAIEGGQQYGSLKLYAGATGRRGHSAFTSSYGFQIGTTFADGVPSFSKHLVDLGFMTRVTGAALVDGTDPFRGPLNAGVHRSLDLQTRFTAGVLENSSAAPIAE